MLKYKVDGSNANNIYMTTQFTSKDRLSVCMCVYTSVCVPVHICKGVCLHVCRAVLGVFLNYCSTYFFALNQELTDPTRPGNKNLKGLLAYDSPALVLQEYTITLFI